MRRFLLASFLVCTPAIACAQSAAHPPSSAPDDMGPFPPFAPPRHSALSPDQHILMAFYAANTTHDGHLTFAQAKTAHFKLVVDHFKAIDVSKRGYVTFYDIQAWKLDQFARHLEKQADALREMDNTSGR